MPIDVAEPVAEALSIFWQIDPVLFGVLGFPPLPCTTDGWATTGGVTGVGHPVFWLPARTRLARFFADDAFEFWRPTLDQIRLWFEISVRGFGDLLTGDVFDVLVANGVDPQSPPFADMKVGISDSVRPDFVRDLVVPVHEDFLSDELLAWCAADAAARTVRALYKRWGEVELADCRHSDEIARDEIARLSVPELMESFESASRRYANNPSSDAIDGLFRAVATTVTRISGVAQTALQLDAHTSRLASGFASVSEERSHRSAVSGEFHRLYTLAIALISDAPRSELASVLTDVWNLLATTAHRWLTRATEAAKAPSPSTHGDRLPPAPPPLVIPAHLEADVRRLEHVSAALVHA
jgi:hypothetical protein